MTVEEMFKALYYKRFEDGDRIIYSKRNEDIVFYKNKQQYYVDFIGNIKPKLHKAITKQMEELG